MKKGFIDEATITAIGGSGGDGIISFLRERDRPHGGPNGGDGGHGGNVYLTASRQVKTLLELSRHHRWDAPRGKHGMGANRHGATGKHLQIFAPIGTRVTDADTGYLHADLSHPGAATILARGGHGGLGNARFKSSTNQVPRQRTTGETGEERRFHLELRALADIGLFGMPNAGKSSLLRALSAARPKVAAYPFTTLSPQLGAIVADDGDTAIIADIPGLIAGAAAGAGLGNRFLRHLMRAALLCHVVDMAADNPVADCQLIEKELAASTLPLIKKPRWLLLNKCDLLRDEECRWRLAEMRQHFAHFERVCVLSALSGKGTRELSFLLLKHAHGTG